MSCKVVGTQMHLSPLVCLSILSNMIFRLSLQRYSCGKCAQFPARFAPMTLVPINVREVGAQFIGVNHAGI